MPRQRSHSTKPGMSSGVDIKSKQPLIVYLSDEILSKTEKFVYWTNDVLHFGAIVTSRAEAVHSPLKSQLHYSVGDLKAVWTRSA
ncbi:hypothetical protein V1515DRAFT_410452 [Lipomyces mesembrius]